METNVNKSNENINNGKKVPAIIADVIFWILSVFVLIFAMGAFAISGGAVGGIILVTTAILTNPFVYKLINRKIPYYKRLICLIVCLAGFFVGILTIPATENIVNENEISKISDSTATTNEKKDDKTDKKNKEANKQGENEKIDKSKEETSSEKSKEAFEANAVEGDLPEIDNRIVEKMTEAGYSIEHATEIQRILNTCGITSLEIYFQTGEAEKGLNAMSCYANGSKEHKSRFTVSTEDGVVFYVGFLNEDLYDIDQGGFLMKYTDVHIPETKVDMDTYLTLQSLAADAVESCLNYPNSADFKELYWGVGRSDDNYKIKGVVNAQNGFGVDSDINFGVWFKKVNDKFIIEGVTLDGIRVK